MVKAPADGGPTRPAIDTAATEPAATDPAAPETAASAATGPETAAAERADEHRRMRWASRRGMLELDLILEPFVDHHYPQLSTADRQLYRDLMGCQDQELFGWFLRKEQPGDPGLQRIVRLILDAQRAAPDGR